MQIWVRTQDKKTFVQVVAIDVVAMLPDEIKSSIQLLESRHYRANSGKDQSTVNHFDQLIAEKKAENIFYAVRGYPTGNSNPQWRMILGRYRLEATAMEQMEKIIKSANVNDSYTMDLDITDPNPSLSSDPICSARPTEKYSVIANN